MSKHVKVNPCPFCGSGNILELSGHSVSWMVCDDCKAEGPVGTVSWDSRAPSPAFEAMVEALEPFALVAEHDIGGDETNEDLFRPFASNHNRAPRLKVGDLRRAHTALALARGER